MTKRKRAYGVSDLAQALESMNDSLDMKLDNLARAVKDGFESVDEQFDDVRKRIDHIELASMANHERRIQRIEDALALPKTR
jgi:hypothetical protein